MEESNKVDILIGQCIDALADDQANQGANALMELAMLFSLAGFPRSNFNDTRMYIINEAKKRDQCPKLIEMKLKMAEQDMRKLRNNDRAKRNISIH